MSTDHGQMNAQSLFRSLRPRPAPVPAAAGSTQTAAGSTPATAAERPVSSDAPRATPQAFEVLAIGPWPILREVSLTAAPVPPPLSEDDKIRRRGAHRTTLASTPPASPLALPEVGTQLAQGLMKTREHWLSERFAQLRGKRGPARAPLVLQPAPACAPETNASMAPAPAREPAARSTPRAGLFQGTAGRANLATPAPFDAKLSLTPVAPAVVQTQPLAPAPTSMTEKPTARAHAGSEGKDLQTVFSRLAAARHKAAPSQPLARTPLDLDPR